MTYAFTQDVPISMGIYERIRAALGNETPAGLVVHVVIAIEEGLRYVDVWESEEACARFTEERLHPVIGRVFKEIGFRPPAEEPPRQRIDVREVWRP